MANQEYSDHRMNNVANVTYTYKPDPKIPEYEESKTSKSNILPLKLQYAPVVNLAVKKITCRRTVGLEERINYQIVATNDGDVGVCKGVIRDSIDNGTAYIENSSKIYYTAEGDGVTLSEFSSIEEAIDSGFLTDNQRWKWAILIRDFALQILDQYSMESWGGERQNLLHAFQTAKFTTIDEVNVCFNQLTQSMDTGFTGQGGLYRACMYLHQYMEENIPIEAISPVMPFLRRDSDGNDVAGVDLQYIAHISRYLFQTDSWVMEGDETDPANEKIETKTQADYINFINNMAIVVDSAIYGIENGYYSKAGGADTGRYNKGILDIALLRTIVDESNPDSLYGKYMTNGQADPVKIADTDYEDIKMKYDKAYSIILSVLPEGRHYLPIEVTGKQPPVIYTRFGAYMVKSMARAVTRVDPPATERISKLMEVLNPTYNAIAVAGMLLTRLPADQMVTIEKLHSAIRILEEISYSLLFVAVTKRIDVNVTHASSAIYTINQVLEEQLDAVKNEVIVPIQFHPLKAVEGDAPNPVTFEPFEYPAMLGNNPVNPVAEGGIYPSIGQTQYNSLLKIIHNASYVIVPDAAKEYIAWSTDAQTRPDHTEKRIRLKRELEYHLDSILNVGAAFVLKFMVKVAGKELHMEKDLDDNNQEWYGLNSINYIETVNEEKISNRMSIGYVGIVNGVINPDTEVKAVDPVNSTEALIAPVELKYAEIYVSKEAFLKTYCESTGRRDYCGKDAQVFCSDEVCCLITMKNYGPVGASNTVVRDLQHTGLDFTNYVPKYEKDVSGVPVLVENVLAFSCKAYDPSKTDNDYVTGENNQTDATYLSVYECRTLAEVAKVKAKGNQGAPYVILLENMFVELNDFKVPARRTVDALNRIRTELYDDSKRQQDKTNDKMVGVGEFRIYYTINCDELIK